MRHVFFFYFLVSTTCTPRFAILHTTLDSIARYYYLAQANGSVWMSSPTSGGGSAKFPSREKPGRLSPGTPSGRAAPPVDPKVGK